MEMFEPGTLNERIGPLKKAPNLKENLEQVEAYALDKLKALGLETAYDVIANEPFDFFTMGYTAYATSFIFQPLCLDIRQQMITDAIYDNCEIIDYASMLRDNVKNNLANKYTEREDHSDTHKPKKFLVVLPGSNKLKERVCLNKLKSIRAKHGNEILFKPHPITTHAVVGELKDMFGERNILPRDADLYYYLQNAEKVYTTHISESAMYALALGKEIEPIDVFNEVHGGSFYNINKVLFAYQEQGDELINKMCSSYKSGFINTTIDNDWKDKIDKYIDYIVEYKRRHSKWFVIKKQKDGKKEIQGN